MRHLRSIIAFCLAGWWLPATQHCGLEAAELLEMACATEAPEGDCHGDDACALDACQDVEGGEYRVNVRSAGRAAPAVVAVVGGTPPAVPAAPAAAPAVLRSDGDERPADWIVQWVFVRRAAALAHAPDVSSV